METTITRPTTPKRYDGLDAVRGIAALMVAWGHSFIAVKFSGQDLLWTRPEPAGWDARIVSALMYAFDGTVAVTTFFILSGIVLGLSLDGRAVGVREYAGF